MKNRIIRERFAALTALSARALPSPTAVHKVSALIVTRFREAYQHTEELRSDIINKDLPLPTDADGDRLPVGLAEARTLAIENMLNLDTPVRKIPDTLRLNEADMPRALKGDGGWKNAEGVAEIIVNLGSLYVLSDEERKLRASVGKELEPDDATYEEIALVEADLMTEHEAQ